MHKVLRPEEPELIDCEICLTQIPTDSGVSVESEDYVYHFCGVRCYEEWKKNALGQAGE